MRARGRWRARVRDGETPSTGVAKSIVNSGSKGLSATIPISYTPSNKASLIVAVKLSPASSIKSTFKVPLGLNSS